MKKAIAGLGIILGAFAAIILVRTLLYTPAPIETAEPVAIAVDASAVAQHLSEAVQFRTVSQAPPARRDDAEFDGFLAWAETTYPELHQSLEKTMVAEHTLFFRWPGKDDSLAPILLSAHYDVVPVVPGTEEDWTHPPYSGAIADGIVWGRGALDDKSAVITMMEAATLLLKQGFEPERTVYFAFDHDEEIGGREGAAGIVALLKEQGITLAWSLDEGSFVLEGLYPGMDLPVASINVAEKGFMTLELVARGDYGHSSMPSKDASIFLLAEAIQKLRDNPLPGGLDGTSLQSLDVVARHQSFSMRLLMANRWLFGGIIDRQMASIPAFNASMRTTTAPTMLSAGIKENVLPPRASATVNFRIHPNDTPEEVIEMVRKIINDERVEVIPPERHSTPSAVASTKSEGFEAIARATRQIYGPVVVVPGMTMAGTNSKHYETVAENAYRINLMAVGPKDIAGFHGTNESITIENLENGTAAYAQLITLGASK